VEIADLLTNALKILAVILVLAAVYCRQNRRSLLTPVAVTALAASLAINVIRGGTGGLIFSISGIALTAVFSLPLYKLGRISRNEAATTLAVGGILGPFGSVIVLLIVTALYALQRILGTGRIPVNECIHGMPARCAGDYMPDDIKSPIAEIEARRMLTTEELEIGRGDPYYDPWEDRFKSHGAGRTQNILPLQAKLALAALAVLILETPF